LACQRLFRFAGDPWYRRYIAHDHPRAAHVATAHFQSHCRQRQRPVEGGLLPKLVVRNLQPPRGRKSNSGDDLVGEKVVLPFLRSFWDNVKLFQRQLTFALGSGELDLRTIGDQDRHDGRRADELRRPIISENRVISVFTNFDQVLTRLVARNQTQSPAKVPAPRPLTKISAQRRQVSNLRAGSFVDGFGQGRIICPKLRGLRQLVQSRKRPHAYSLPGTADGLHARQLFDVHQTLRSQDIVLHQGQQVSSTGDDFGLSPGFAQQAQRLGLRFGSDVVEGSHHAPAFCYDWITTTLWCMPDGFNALSTRSGVSGRNGTRTPIALATALEMTAPGEITGGSPKPMTPRSSYPLPVIM